MFSILVIGRQVQTKFEIDEARTRYIFTIPKADTVNDVAVFMTGSRMLPKGFVGTVHIKWPKPNTPSNWQPLGVITNEKPSSLFKLFNFKSFEDNLVKKPLTLENSAGQQPIFHNAQIGISVKPLEIVNQDVATKSPQLSDVSLLSKLLSFVSTEL